MKNKKSQFQPHGGAVVAELRNGIHFDLQAMFLSYGKEDNITLFRLENRQRKDHKVQQKLDLD